MRLPWRTVPAVALLASGLLPISHASAGWSCTYYKWDASASRWNRVALLEDEDVYEHQSGHARYQSWDCKYCYVPAVPPRPNGNPFETVNDDANQAAATARAATPPAVAQARDGVEQMVVTTIGIDPFGGPDCPAVPPEWDAI